MKTKFNVGDTVYRLVAKALLDEADEGGIALFQSIMAGVEKTKIEAIYVDKTGVWYETSGTEVKVRGKDFFATEEEVFFILLKELQDHLRENLDRAVELSNLTKNDFTAYRKRAMEDNDGKD